MKKTATAWLITATALVLVGCVLFGGVMMALKWDFTKLSTTTFETNEHRVTQAYHSIALNTDTADIAFVPSEDGTTKVVCHEETRITHAVTVKDDTLCIDRVDSRKWHERIGIDIGSTSVTVYLPQGDYTALNINEHTGNVNIPADFTFDRIDIVATTGRVACAASARGDLNIKADTGDIRVDAVTASTMNLAVSTGAVTVNSATVSGDVSVKVSTGKASLTDVTCANVTSTGSTGKLVMTNVVASGKFHLERSTGDVHFVSCDAGEITVKTSTGDVSGSLLSDKIFFAQTDTGRVDVPKSINGGTCEITTDTGDIVLTVE